MLQPQTKEEQKQHHVTVIISIATTSGHPHRLRPQRLLPAVLGLGRPWPVPEGQGRPWPAPAF
eukprot:8583205-Lingulodinium_polyedra.AAC.1